MQNITSDFQQYYQPKTALLIYRHTSKLNDVYVESFEIDQTTGQPINAHPLSIEEAAKLGRQLNSAQEKHMGFLVPDGLMPETVLYVNPRSEGLAIWYTPPMKRKLFFSKHLEIKDGPAYVPALLWKATKSQLYIFALKSKKRPTVSTPLYHAPLFNTAANGLVCIGDVTIPSLETASLGRFMQAWQDFFFNSKFSHLNGLLPVSVDPKELWNELIKTGKPFPNELLLTSKTTLKSILP
ncbi:PRTRC system protein B [Spirosoma endbachense]|uniref:PRTRC system protein B n=1 Tax=Spirosoma endbachense TaxID=2666025 RepID=A0A6P1W593_9BACT|nr:PRTRC system protein B [Spirosoma endbachense]QHV99197.1 PRTRC system protein B [Spirosoma endbachense]